MKRKSVSPALFDNSIKTTKQELSAIFGRCALRGIVKGKQNENMDMKFSFFLAITIYALKGLQNPHLHESRCLVSR